MVQAEIIQGIQELAAIGFPGIEEHGISLTTSHNTKLARLLNNQLWERRGRTWLDT